MRLSRTERHAKELLESICSHLGYKLEAYDEPCGHVVYHIVAIVFPNGSKFTRGVIPADSTFQSALFALRNRGILQSFDDNNNSYFCRWFQYNGESLDEIDVNLTLLGIRKS